MMQNGRISLRQVKSRFNLLATSHFLAQLPSQVKTYQVPITTLIPRITLFAICLSFSSPPLHPCHFIRPLFPFASFCLLLVSPCVIMANPSIIVSTPDHEVLNFKQKEG